MLVAGLVEAADQEARETALVGGDEGDRLGAVEEGRVVAAEETGTEPWEQAVAQLVAVERRHVSEVIGPGGPEERRCGRFRHVGAPMYGWPMERRSPR